ncbi:MAG: ABC transporter substrate-binding protein [Anaerolineae bacterium]|jgi:NitT/TauT family transport system substrate-binding protein
MKWNSLWIAVTSLILLSLVMAGCGGADPTAQPAEPTAEVATQAAPATETPDTSSESPVATPGSDAMESPLPTPGGDAMTSPLPTPEIEGEIQTLRMALLPVLDVLPFHVAEQNGYFGQVGVQVELVPVKSAQENATLMQTGQIEGTLTDLLFPVLFNQSEEAVKTVRTARKAYPDSHLFSIVAAPGSDVQSPSDLAGMEIGISQNTVIEYLTDRMLENAGLTPDQIATQEVSAIPVRYELLLNDQIPAATLPEPLTSGAIAAGAVLVVDDTTIPDSSQSILVFSNEALQEKPEAVRRFLVAWEMAVDELNSNPEPYRPLLIEKGRVPEAVQDTFQMPPFPEASVPSPAQLADVMEWATDKGIIENQVPYESLVDDGYLP